jgi:hypothetical protein
MNAASTRKVVIVLGMHRSGTSALTRVLNLLGCAAPRTLMVPDVNNPSGYWESRPISDLNDRILESAGSHWADWQEVNPNWIHTPVAETFAKEAATLLEHEYGDSPLFVLKDPRISLLMPFWRAVFDRAGIEAVAVHTVRDPREVAASLAKREGFQAARSLLIWLRYNLDAERGSRGLPRFFTSYDQVLNDVRTVISQSEAALGGFWPRKSERVLSEIAAYLSGPLRHHKEDMAAFKEPPYAVPWIRQTNLMLQSWVQGGESATDFHQLDSVRWELGLSGPAFERIVVEFDAYAAEVRRLEVELADVEEKRRNEEERANQVCKRLEHREQQLAALEAQLAAGAGELQQSREQAQKRVGALSADLSAAHDQLRAADEQRCEVIMRNEHYLKEMESLGKTISELQRTISDRNAEVTALEANIMSRDEATKRAEDVLLKLRAANSASRDEIAALTRNAAIREEALRLAESKVKELVSVLAQTQNELRQRQHEAEQTALALGVAKNELVELKIERSALRGEMRRAGEQQKESIDAFDRARLELEVRIAAQADVIAELTELAEGRAEALQQTAGNGRAALDQFQKVIQTLLNLPNRSYRSRRMILQRQAALLKESGIFDPEWYLLNNPDVAANGVDPSAHFIRYGNAEGRPPCQALAVIAKVEP